MPNDRICGTDEVGYGAYAGDLLVVAVSVPKGWTGPAGLTDSKKLTPKRREALAAVLLADPALRYCECWVSPEDIDAMGVYQANNEAHRQAHEHFQDDAEHVADGDLPLGHGIRCLPKADTLIPAVSAASVIAKVKRDQKMKDADKLYAGYDFGKHAGYGVPAHQAALDRLGPCPLHRRSFGPVAASEKAKLAPSPALYELLDTEEK